MPCQLPACWLIEIDDVVGVGIDARGVLAELREICAMPLQEGIEVCLGSPAGIDLRLNQLAAIKVLHAHLTEAEAEHFYQEAQTISTLVHPSIIRVFDYDVQDGVPFLVMDYAPKGTQVPLPQIVFG